MPLLFVWGALAGSGCGNGEAGRPAADVFTDDLGREVVIDRPVRRVVTLAPNLTEIVYAAGAGHRLAGVGMPDDYPPAVDTLPRFSVFPVDFEAVVALRPDLVLATDQVNSERDAATFAALDLPVAFLSFRGLDDVLRGIRVVGELLGTETEAAAAVDAIEARIDRLRAYTAGRETHPRVLFLIGDDVLYSFGRESYMHELIDLAGGTSVMEDVDAVAPVLSEEFVLTRRPDVIVGPWGTDYDPRRLMELHPTWDVVPAVREGRVYSVDPDLFLRPGPRLVDAAYVLADLLHPDRAARE